LSPGCHTNKEKANIQKMYCKTCGTILQPRKTAYGKWMSCPNGHSQPELVQSSEPIKFKNNQQGNIVTVHDGKNMLAVHDHSCKKCGYNKCELIEVQPFYSDEDQFLRMKCGECGYTEKLEGKLG
jgi:DNA-directed RNA polymerase subunit M/transcription elongation factor TFIIS